MAALNETIKLRAAGELISAAEAWAGRNGETVSGMIRRLLAAEVPGAPSGDLRGPLPDEASAVADLLAGVEGARHRLLLLVRTGTPEQKDALLRILAGYLVWEYRAPPDAEALAEIITETDRLLLVVEDDEREYAGKAA